jgi:hypothetical protein
MPDEKDRLGDTLHKKEKADEDRYFAELQKKQLEKLRERNAASKAAGHGQCPRCGSALVVRDHKGVATDTCPKGCGTWLDKGELETIDKREGDGWLARILFGSRRA